MDPYVAGWIMGGTTVGAAVVVAGLIVAHYVDWRRGR
jgi:hypothetical protein